MRGERGKDWKSKSYSYEHGCNHKDERDFNTLGSSQLFWLYVFIIANEVDM